MSNISVQKIRDTNQVAPVFAGDDRPFRQGPEPRV